MNRYLKQYGIVGAIVATVTLLSFSKSTSPGEKTADYYDKQTDNLLRSLSAFEHVSKIAVPVDSLRRHLFNCRTSFKKTELFVDVFMPYKARVINGPDLLKIDEENPSDSMKPHGFQVIERILYDSDMNRKELTLEISLLKATIHQQRYDPDRKFYFSDAGIWLAMRLGVYRIISMGVTGFDVPLSYHALPETRAVLSSVKAVASFYKASMPDSVWHKGEQLIKNADRYLAAHNNFNTFDRLTYIRSYINPLSSWLTDCGKIYIQPNTLYPLNLQAANLFAKDIINIRFFSPNDDYTATPSRIALGRKLFYDPILSGNGSRSCASCHKPELAFTDGLVTPTDISGKKQLPRNTPTLLNSALQTAQFYDSRAKVLEVQLSAVVHNTDEMDGSLINSIPRLLADSAYTKMFGEAYKMGPAPITEYNIANAVSSYIRTLISFNSRFDQYMRGEIDSLTTAERNGFNLFMGKAKCGTCHYAPLFNGLVPPLYQDTESETLAVPATNDSSSVLDTDEGRFSFTRQPFHKFSFKTPTVRNIALTGPYMHNGVFGTLEAVIDFYNDGGGAGRGIDLDTQTLPTEKLNLTVNEKKNIIAFLNTLTDTVTVR